jgi:hypothetical protein
MKFSRSDFEMQRFESRRPSQPVRLQRVRYEGRSKTSLRDARLIGEGPVLGRIGSASLQHLSIERVCRRATPVKQMKPKQLCQELV